jgi:hypothetical protein
MLVEITPLREVLVAQLTDKGFLTGVYPHMVSDVSWFEEHSVAVGVQTCELRWIHFSLFIEDLFSQELLVACHESLMALGRLCLLVLFLDHLHVFLATSNCLLAGVKVFLEVWSILGWAQMELTFSNGDICHGCEMTTAKIMEFGLALAGLGN